MMMIIAKLATLIMMMMASLTMLMVKKHLFRQSKINYTVLKDSPYMEYFKVTSLYICHWMLIMIMMIMMIMMIAIVIMMILMMNEGDC